MADKVDAATQTMVRNLEEKTGKTMDQWVAVVKKQGPKKHGELVAFLKDTHQMGHGYANLVVHTAAGQIGAGAPAGEDLVAAQYAGDKAALKPIYDMLHAAITKFGPDVEVSPKKAGVSFRRSKQFALIGPGSKTRIDVGLNLKGVPASERLEAWTGMCTHRVRVESPAQIDKALLGWIRDAYDKA
jgi:predicted transport protein